ncbi:MAG: hypothetical protein QXK13_03170 [Fervidicoccaceae archaeon]
MGEKFDRKIVEISAEQESMPEISYESSKSLDGLVALLPSLRNENLRLFSGKRDLLLLFIESSVLEIAQAVINLQKKGAEIAGTWIFPKEDGKHIGLIALQWKNLGKSLPEASSLLSACCQGLQTIQIVKNPSELTKALFYSTDFGGAVLFKILRDSDSCEELEQLVKNSFSLEKSLDRIMHKLEESSLFKLTSIKTLYLNGKPFSLYVSFISHPKLNVKKADCLTRSLSSSMKTYLEKKYGLKLDEPSIFLSGANKVEIVLSLQE